MRWPPPGIGLGLAAALAAAFTVTGCSGEEPASCADASAAVIEAAGFPAEFSEYAAVAGDEGAWFVGIPADLVSVHPEVAVYATDADPGAVPFEGTLLPANDLAAGTKGEPVASDAFDDADVVTEATACVHLRTAEAFP
ncbi:MAG: hypothetical protein WD739_01355 [Actinomycetota bacterium]